MAKHQVLPDRPLQELAVAAAVHLLGLLELEALEAEVLVGLARRDQAPLSILVAVVAAAV
jgi:hypothetical protein